MKDDQWKQDEPELRLALDTHECVILWSPFLINLQKLILINQ